MVGSKSSGVPFSRVFGQALRLDGRGLHIIKATYENILVLVETEIESGKGKVNDVPHFQGLRHHCFLGYIILAVPTFSLPPLSVSGPVLSRFRVQHGLYPNG